jgi:hypothetical protein
MRGDAVTSTAGDLVVDFAGEIFTLTPGKRFAIGRQGDLELDDNPFLHRRLAELAHSGGLWWVENVGSRLSLSLTDGHGLMRTVLGPSARMPLVFPRVVMSFAAGPTAYELHLTTSLIGFTPPEHSSPHSSGETTVGPERFTPAQRLLILSLAEPVLRRAGSGSSKIPASADAAKRLGWSITRFNRKLDNVCDKLSAVGVAGLRGTSTGQATNRRVALVEYAVSSLLVRAEDLPLLDMEYRANSQYVGSRRPQTGDD